MSNLPILTSIHGRRFGLDQAGAPIFAYKRTGADVRGTSDTTATSLHNNGFVSVVTTTDDTWQLKDPFQGALVTLMTGSSSTGIHSINLTNSVAYSTVGIAGSTVVLTGPGAAITLFGYTTAIWLHVGSAGSSASAYVSS
jgi:hypothetical protein